MKRILALAAAIALSGNFALAAITADDLVRTYQDSGYISIEVTTGVTQIKVEAIKEGQKIEVVYDIETGTALTTETSTLDPSIVVMPRVEVKVADDDEFAAEDVNDDEGDDENSVAGNQDDDVDNHSSENNGDDDYADTDGSNNDDNQDHGDDHGEDD